MHMRTKKWARPELSACPFYVNGGEEIRGRWKERFPEPGRPLHMEMGCGKGVSTAAMIADHPEINYIICDVSPDVLGTARRNIAEKCGEEPDNVQILRTDICFIHRVFAPEDAADRLSVDIVLCVDCLDASTDSVGRSYKQNRTLETFIGELRKGKGTQYAPFLVEMFEEEAFCEELRGILGTGRNNNYRRTYHTLEHVMKPKDTEA